MPGRSCHIPPALPLWSCRTYWRRGTHRYRGSEGPTRLEPRTGARKAHRCEIQTIFEIDARRSVESITAPHFRRAGSRELVLTVHTAPTGIVGSYASGAKNRREKGAPVRNPDIFEIDARSLAVLDLLKALPQVATSGTSKMSTTRSASSAGSAGSVRGEKTRRREVCINCEVEGRAFGLVKDIKTANPEFYTPANKNTAAKLYCRKCVEMGGDLEGCLPQHREHLQDNRSNAIAKRSRETTRRDAAQVCVHAIMHRSSQSQLCLSKCYTLKH